MLPSLLASKFFHEQIWERNHSLGHWNHILTLWTPRGPRLDKHERPLKWTTVLRPYREPANRLTPFPSNQKPISAPLVVAGKTIIIMLEYFYQVLVVMTNFNARTASARVNFLSMTVDAMDHAHLWNGCVMNLLIAQTPVMRPLIHVIMVCWPNCCSN